MKRTRFLWLYTKSTAKRVQKILTQVDENEKLSEEFKRKVFLLKQLKCRVLYRCHEISVTKSNYYIVSELMKQETLQKRLKNQSLNQEQLSTLISSFAIFIKRMKQVNIFHGNLNPSMINIRKNRAKIQLINIKAIEILQKIQRQDQFLDQKVLKNEELVYYPPQVLYNRTFSQKTDSWALGVILFQSIYQQLPWNIQSISIRQFLKKTAYQDIKFAQNELMTKQLSHLLYGCLRPDQDLRFCFDDILTHQIFKSQMIKNSLFSNENGIIQTLQSIGSRKTLIQEQNNDYQMRRKN